MNSEDTLQAIQARLAQPVSPLQVIEELLPRTPAEAVTWVRRLTSWDEFRGQFPGQVVALARVVSLRAMTDFGLTISDDGRVVERPRQGKPWQTPEPTLTFPLAVRGEEVRVEYTAGYFPGGDTDCFYFVNPHSRGQPHCLSESGYFSHFASHDAVEACGGARAYAALFAEARLRGEETEFDATFEGEDPKRKQPRRKTASLPVSPPVAKPLPVLGEHTAQALGQQEAKKDTHESPRQGLLF